MRTLSFAFPQRSKKAMVKRERKTRQEAVRRRNKVYFEVV
jgi:hypothetical protein